MLDPLRLTETFAVSAELGAPDDFAAVRALGFTTLISLLPDSESALPAAAAGRAAERAGLRFVHVPAHKYDLFTSETVEAMREALHGSSGPILAMCASGQRAAIVWAAVLARDGLGVGHILEALADAGLDLAFLRDDLEAQADKQRLFLACPIAQNAGRAAA